MGEIKRDRWEREIVRERERRDGRVREREIYGRESERERE